jgi:hypothetical protein
MSPDPPRAPGNFRIPPSFPYGTLRGNNAWCKCDASLSRYPTTLPPG